MKKILGLCSEKATGEVIFKPLAISLSTGVCLGAVGQVCSNSALHTGGVVIIASAVFITVVILAVGELHDRFKKV